MGALHNNENTQNDPKEDGKQTSKINSSTSKFCLDLAMPFIPSIPDGIAIIYLLYCIIFFLRLSTHVTMSETKTCLQEQK